MNSGHQQSSLRVIAGKWRSRKISFPTIDELRPTSNRVRETLFNWLQGSVKGEDCLDLFAGSGACGIEALSRGARSVVFVEKNRDAAGIIKENLRALGADSVNVQCTDVISWLESASTPLQQKFGLVFIDPPYDANLEKSCCWKLEQSGRLKSAALIYLESDKRQLSAERPPNWDVIKSKKAGRVNFYLFRRTGSINKGTT